MALVIRIGSYTEHSEPDTLGRTWTGYFPRMTETEAYEAGRGVWVLGPRSLGERFALIVGGGSNGDGLVRAVVEIDDFHDEPDSNRRSFTGTVLDAAHPIHEAYLGTTDPSGSRSRNPIAYAELPEEREYKQRHCACGCGTETRNDFAAGHDLRAIQQRIGESFDGSTVRFLEWFDEHRPRPAAA